MAGGFNSSRADWKEAVWGIEPAVTVIEEMGKVHGGVHSVHWYDEEYKDARLDQMGG
jgi:hypothetical protein